MEHTQSTDLPGQPAASAAAGPPASPASPDSPPSGEPDDSLGDGGAPEGVTTSEDGTAPDGSAAVEAAPYGTFGYGTASYGTASYGTATGQPPTAAPSARRGWLLLAVFCSAELVFVVVSLFLVIPYTGERQLSGGGLALALVVPTVAAAVVALIGSAWLGSGPRLDLRLRWDKRDLGIGLLFGLGGLPLTAVASLLWARAVGPDRANSAVGEVFGDQRLALPLAIGVFLVVWLVAPLCEEVLYRGVLWGAFERWRWNRWVIFGVTTLVFSIAHLEWLRTPLLIVISIPIGLARLFTGNTAASIVAHQANNFLPAVGLLLTLLGVQLTG